MQPVKKKGTSPTLARWCILSIQYHDFICSCIRIYVWFAVFVMLVLAVAQIIPLQTALRGILLMSLGFGALLWVLIERRRTLMLSIEDPELKRKAHEAMLDLIGSRQMMEHPDSPSWRGYRQRTEGKKLGR